MKKLIQLGLLAALAGGSVHAVTVNFDTSLTPTSNNVTVTGSDGLVVARAYTHTDGAITPWAQVFVGQDLGGVGANGGGSAYEVEGTWKEYVVFDFAATVTGQVKVDSILLNFPNTPQGPTYFTYQWITTLPSGSSPSVPGTFASYQNGGAGGVTGTGAMTLSDITGQGKYLILGAINGSFSTSNMFSVQTINYTSVPDGASTLALMGAAVATLGLAARRRKQ
jgi:hypothetical protein